MIFERLLHELPLKQPKTFVIRLANSKHNQQGIRHHLLLLESLNGQRPTYKLQLQNHKLSDTRPLQHSAKHLGSYKLVGIKFVMFLFFQFNITKIAQFQDVTKQEELMVFDSANKECISVSTRFL